MIAFSRDSPSSKWNCLDPRLMMHTAPYPLYRVCWTQTQAICPAACWVCESVFTGMHEGSIVQQSANGLECVLLVHDVHIRLSNCTAYCTLGYILYITYCIPFKNSLLIVHIESKHTLCPSLIANTEAIWAPDSSVGRGYILKNRKLPSERNVESSCGG